MNYLELADKALMEFKAHPQTYCELSERSELRYDANLPDQSTATEPFNQEAMDAIKRGQVVPVWSDLLGEWLYWVRDELKRKALQAQGCTAPIYTLGELAVVASMSPEDIKKLHGIKKAFGGVIQS